MTLPFWISASLWCLIKVYVTLRYLCLSLCLSVSLFLSLSLSLSLFSTLIIVFPAAQPICLPDPAQDYVNVSTVVTGWGKTSGDPKDKSSSAILQEGNLTIISNSQCNQWIISKKENLTLTDNMICALNPKESGCEGDSGGPLITLAENGTYEQESRVLKSSQSQLF